MVNTLLTIFFGVSFLFLLELRKAYAIVTAKELKRQAQQDDELAKKLYKATAYGASLSVLLLCSAVVSAAICFSLLTSKAGVVIATPLIAIILGYGFVWIPGSGNSRIMVRVAAFCTPVISWITSQLHPFIGGVASRIRHHRDLNRHTGLYEAEDLIALMQTQEGQPGNRIDADDLARIERVLLAGEKQVVDIMVARKDVKNVHLNDEVGPILMKELHDSGRGQFPVFEQENKDVVGILSLQRATEARSGGKVMDIMDPRVRYIHEDATLSDALKAFFRTKQYLLIVVNNFEECSGIVTIRDVVEHLVGKQSEADFDAYDDLHEVAMKQMEKVRVQLSELGGQKSESEESPGATVISA